VAGLPFTSGEPLVGRQKRTGLPARYPGSLILIGSKPWLPRSKILDFDGESAACAAAVIRAMGDPAPPDRRPLPFGLLFLTADERAVI
jgi:hypothetical protein